MNRNLLKMIFQNSTPFLFFSKLFAINVSTPISKNFRMFFFFRKILIEFYFSTASAAIPESWPCRFLFITGYLMSTVLVTAYSAALISHLTTSNPFRPFDSLRELYDDGTYTLTAIDRSSEYSYFAVSNKKSFLCPVLS